MDLNFQYGHQNTTSLSIYFWASMTMHVCHAGHVLSVCGESWFKLSASISQCTTGESSQLRLLKPAISYTHSTMLSKARFKTQKINKWFGFLKHHYTKRDGILEFDGSGFPIYSELICWPAGGSVYNFTNHTPLLCNGNAPPGRMFLN